MSKFNKGDRVILVEVDSYDAAAHGLRIGDAGVIDQDNSSCPWVLFGSNRCAVLDFQMELNHDHSIEINGVTVALTDEEHAKIAATIELKAEGLR